MTFLALLETCYPVVLQHIRGVIKNYGECCCRERSNGKAGITPRMAFSCLALGKYRTHSILRNCNTHPVFTDIYNGLHNLWFSGQHLHRTSL